MNLKRLKKNAAILLSIIFIVISISVQTEATTTAVDTNENEVPVISSEIGYVLEVNTGAVLYDNGGNIKAYPASITKILTSLIALRDGKLDDKITFSNEAIFSVPLGYSHIALDVGEELTLEQTLYAALLPSANEAAYGIAEHISGSVEAFSKNMNETAKSLGALDSNFVNPNGLHDENHYTTAHDMALFMKEAIKYDKFLEIIATRRYYIPPTNIKEERYILNTNETIKVDSQYYNELVVGAKTGYTQPAGKTLVTYAKKGDVELVVVVLNGTASGVFEDTNTLINGYLDDDAGIVTESTSAFNNIVIPSAVGQPGMEGKVNVNIKLASTISYFTSSNNSNEYIKKLEAPETINTIVNIGDKIGELVVYNNKDVAVGKVDLIIDSFLIDEESIVEPQITNGNDFFQFKSGGFSIANVVKWALIVIGILLVLLFIYAKLLDNKSRRYKRRNKRKHSPSWKQYK